MPEKYVDCILITNFVENAFPVFKVETDSRKEKYKTKMVPNLCVILALEC